MVTRIRQALPVLTLAAMLGACTTLPPQQPVTQQQIEARRIVHQSIDIGGRLSARYEQQGQQLLTGSFTWVERPGHTKVTMLSPFGQTVARLEITPVRATFQLAGEPAQSASDIDQLAARALGWPLPVSGLRLWLQGFVRTTSGELTAADPGAQSALTSNDGWRVLYSAWVEDPATGALRPRRIDSSRQTREAGEVNIRIIIDSWQPLPGAASQ